MSDEPTITLTSGRRKAAMGFIFATALMDVIAMGLMIPVLPNLVKEMVGGDYATATFWTGIFGTAWGLLQFFCSPILGMLSDRFGRRPVLLISIFGLSVDYVFMALAPSLAWLFVGRVINGMTAASFSTAGAYVADVTPPAERARNFGLIGAAFSIGFVIGPAIGGYLGEISLRLPFYVSAALGMINWLYGYFVLPESLPKEKRATRFDWKKANPVGSFKLLRSHPELLGLAGIMALFQLAHSVYPSIFVLYTGYRLSWTPQNVGLMLMAVGAAGALVQFFLVKPTVHKVGERGSLMFGQLAAIAGFTIYAMAPTTWTFVLGIPVFAFAALIGPSAQGLMSRRVAPHEQGQLQGAGSAIMGLTAIVGPLIYTNLFAWTIRHDHVIPVPGLPILFAAFLILVAFLLTIRVTRPVREAVAT